jgi:hypothetical protein
MVMGNQIQTHDRTCELAEHTLAHNRLVLGEDHPHTLASATSLATYLHELGEHERARDLDEDALAPLLPGAG